MGNFHDATKAAEGLRKVLEDVIPNIDFLADILEDAMKDLEDFQFMRESLYASLATLLKHSNKPERSLATLHQFLDPSTK